MAPLSIAAWLKKVHHTQAHEILCSECLERIDIYVDLELQGQDAARLMPDLRHHLDMCRVCEEEYELLRDLASSV